MIAQADMSRLQYKSKEIEAKEAGVEVLKETNKALSTIIAKAAAGGMLPNEGSALLAQTMSIKEGAEDFQVSKLNEEIIQNLGLIEFQNLKMAGKFAKQAGIMGAIFGLGTDIATIGIKTGTPNQGDRCRRYAIMSARKIFPGGMIRPVSIPNVNFSQFQVSIICI